MQPGAQKWNRYRLNNEKKFIIRRQPARTSKTEHRVINLPGIVYVACTQNSQAAHSWRSKNSNRINVSFDTFSLPSVRDFELPQELRERASFTSGRFAVDRISSMQARNIAVSTIRRRSIPPRNVSAYKLIDANGNSSSWVDTTHVVVNKLFNEVPAAEKPNNDGSRSTASDIRDPQNTQITTDLQKAQNLIVKIQNHLHHLGRLLVRHRVAGAVMVCYCRRIFTQECCELFYNISLRRLPTRDKLETKDSFVNS